MRAVGWVAAGAVVIGLGLWAGVRVQRRPPREPVQRDEVGVPITVPQRLQALRRSEPMPEIVAAPPVPAAPVAGAAQERARADFEAALAGLGTLTERKASRSTVRKASQRASQAFEVYSTTVDGTTAAGREQLDAAYAELMAGLRAVESKGGKRRR